MADRKPDDHTGHVIDAGARLYERLVEEHQALVRDGHITDPRKGPIDDAGGQLLHMLVVTWIDRLADEGLLCRHTHHLDILERSLAELGARAWYEKEKHGRG